MLKSGVTWEQVEKEELQKRAEQYDLECLTPFSIPDSYEVFNDDPFPLESFIDRALRKNTLLKSEQNRFKFAANEERSGGEFGSFVAPADDGNEENSYVFFGGRLWKVSAKGASSGGTAPKHKFVLELNFCKMALYASNTLI